MKLFFIAWHNMKKAKAATITLVILVAVVTIFLYVGTNVLTETGSFIDEKNSELNGAHEIIIASRESNEEIQKICKGIDDYSYMEQEDAILLGTSKLQNASIEEEKYAITSLIMNYGTNRSISNVEIIDEAEQIYNNGVLLPYAMKEANGYHTGDILKLYLEEQTIEFKIAGFYEDVMFANSTNLTIYKLYVYNKQFSELESYQGGTKCSVSLVMLKNIQNAIDYENKMLDQIKTDDKIKNSVYITSNYLSLKTGTSIFIMIIMSVLVAFSGIILLISLIVIYFSTATHIENNIKNIGAMEALGYTPKQLIVAIVIEYEITAVLGVIIGISLSLGFTPLITELVSASIGLRWIAAPSIFAALISFVVILLSILVISYISSAKIRKIIPLTALRSGIETHSFKKNRISLDRTRLNVHLAISMKEFIYNKRQNLVAGIIIMMLSVVSILTLTVYYNFVLDHSSMMKLLGIENAQIEIIMPYDTVRIYDEVSKMPEVEKIIKLEGFETGINYKGKVSNTHFQVTEDYSNLQIKTCIKGRMPKHDNEIAMTQLVLNEIGAKIGDTVSVEYNNNSKEYLVVGITQHISYLGKGAEITTDGMKRLLKEYEGKTAMVYLNEKADTSKFITKLRSTYKDKEIQVNSNKETLEMMIESYSAAIRLIAIGCLIIAAIIIVFVMFLVVRARVIKEKMRMGVLKALGYTSNQLMGHILMSQIPVIIVSSIIGAIAGLYTSNPIIALSLAGNGILQCDFYVDMRFVVLTPIGISIIGLLTVLTVSISIKKISPILMLEQSKN